MVWAACNSGVGCDQAGGVSVNRSLWLATAACVFVFVVISAPGALAFGDILQVVLASKLPMALYRLYIGIADGVFIARVWTCRYSK